MTPPRRPSAHPTIGTVLLLVLLAVPASADPTFKGSAAADIICDASRGICREWVPPPNYFRDLWSWGKGRGDWWNWLTANMFRR